MNIDEYFVYKTEIKYLRESKNGWRMIAAISLAFACLAMVGWYYGIR